jgi:hypothetical protein
MGPSKDVPASDLFRKLQERPRPSEVVDVPRYDPKTGSPVSQVRLQVLLAPEVNFASRQALKALKEEQHLTDAELEQSVIKEGIYSTYVAREILALSCVSVEPVPGSEETTGCPIYAKQFGNGRQLEQVLTPDEMHVLFSAYLLTQRKYGPYSSDIRSEEEFTAWILRIVEGGSDYPLLSRDSLQLVELLSRAMGRLYTLCHILDSQEIELPERWASPLRSWGIGTGCYGLPPDTGTPDSTEGISDSSTGTSGNEYQPILRPGDEPIDIELAQRLVKHIRDNQAQ